MNGRAALVFTLSLWLALSQPAVGELKLSTPTLDDPAMDSLRGGFLIGGLEIAIGLDQIVSVNGETLVINRLTIPNLNQTDSSRLTDHSMEVIFQAVGPMQSSGSMISSNFIGQSGWLTHIQNTMDSAVIQNIHQLDIELSNFGSGYQLPGQFADQLPLHLGR